MARPTTKTTTMMVVVAQDAIDQLVAEWRAVRPDLDFAPVEIVSRLRWLQAILDAHLERSLIACGLSGPSFGVLSSLRRQGPPFQLSQRRLMDVLGLTSGTVSVRIDQLVEHGLVQRLPDPADRRGALVKLTASGLAACDACTPAYLKDEDRLLAALGPSEREQLAGLLRRLLLSFEAEHQPDPTGGWLGLLLAPAHVARQRQRELGLDERNGLLVRAVEPDSPAERAGLRPGDLLVSVDGRDLRAPADLVAALAAAGRRRSEALRLGVVRGGHVSLDVALAVPSSRARSAGAARPAGSVSRHGRRASTGGP